MRGRALLSSWPRREIEATIRGNDQGEDDDDDHDHDHDGDDDHDGDQDPGESPRVSLRIPQAHPHPEANPHPEADTYFSHPSADPDQREPAQVERLPSLFCVRVMPAATT